jgi:lysyl-tRNA synthetase class 2
MTDSAAWQPSASIESLQKRAAALATAREFFAARQVMEVETPVLCRHGVTDPHVESIPAGRPADSRWLRTSPEYHMKRLIAAGSKDIYQIGKVFRAGETGRYHQPEFTMIEWYRLGFSLDDMINETCSLISTLSQHNERVVREFKRIDYREAFLNTCGLDPFVADIESLRSCAINLPQAPCDDRLAEQLGDDRHAWLDYLAGHSVYPALRGDALWVVEAYPAEQAMLARLNPDDPALAERFEVFFDGIELANGFRELRDADEQAARFANDRATRSSRGLRDMLPDSMLLAALKDGLPDCCGVAVGLDRLLMLGELPPDIAATMSFAPGC